MWRPRFAPQTIEAWSRFRRMRRAWWSLWILVAAFLLSLGSECISNDRPLVLGYQGRLHFPVLRFYPATDFGGPYRTEPDYLALRDDPAFRAAGGWMVHPPVPFGPIRSELWLPGNPPHPPSGRHWLGTDASARDVFSRLLYGFRTSILFALSLTACAIVLGVAIGSMQGYLGGRVDIATQRLIEIWSALPMLYVVILLGSIYGQSFWMLLGVMAMFEWIGLSFYIRADCFRLKTLGYVQAARAAGASDLRILVRHILPNAMTPLITLSPFLLIGGIGALTSLDFLGFGLPPPTPSWGDLLEQGLNNLNKPWVALSAMCALFVTLLLATFVGEGLRQAFDPKSSTRLR